MTAARATVATIAALFLSGCGGEAAGDDTAPTQTEYPQTPEASPREPAPEEIASAGLTSKECEDVVNYYVDALSSRDFATATRVWFDPAMDAGKLEATYGSFTAFLQPSPPTVEGAAGSLYCTVDIKLDNPANPDAVPVTDTLQLRRVNDVPGATADQLRWTVRSSSFIEKKVAAIQGEP